ncbi:MAG: phosphotransferase family protein [Flavobacteriaceae bacterium]
MSTSPIDKPNDVRPEEALDLIALSDYLKLHLADFKKIIDIKQFPGGYSNLTYLIKTTAQEYVLRKPPRGAKIKSAHDMHREYNVLSLLKPLYKKMPDPTIYCDDEAVIGSPFFMMERVKGVILRNTIPKGLVLDKNAFQKLSTNTVLNMVDLHNLELQQSNLISIGNPDGYVSRQVTGWIDRYFKAETDSIKAMNNTAEWLETHQPTTSATAFIHNDYKYDNLVLDENSLDIKAVLDWEMATVGDPLMDLGTTLAYWVEADDNKALRAFNLTWPEGNLTREEFLETYTECQHLNINDILFYYVFGCFKLAVIAQQIYARYKKGFTKDPRFAGLIFVVNACADNAQNAIKFKRIHDFR